MVEWRTATINCHGYCPFGLNMNIRDAASIGIALALLPLAKKLYADMLAWFESQVHKMPPSRLKTALLHKIE